MHARGLRRQIAIFTPSLVILAALPAGCPTGSASGDNNSTTDSNSTADSNSTSDSNSVAACTSKTSCAWSAMGLGLQAPSRFGTGDVASGTALALFQDKLIVAGAFVQAGGLDSIGCAAWDGTAWTALPALQGATSALQEFNGKLYARGLYGGITSFTALPMLEAYDGGSWTQVGGFDLGVKAGVAGGALTVFNGKLIVGGAFDSIDGVAAANIAQFDGTTWSALGAGTDEVTYGTGGIIGALTTYQGKLIAAGRFDTAGGVPVHNIAQWDGNGWTDLGGGLTLPSDPQVAIGMSLIAYGKYLVVGGQFTNAGGVTTSSIALWDGTTWSALGSGVTSNFPTPANSFPVHPAVKSLTVYNCKLIAGGFFNQVGGQTASGVAQWDGTSWTPLGLGTTPLVDQTQVGVSAVLQFGNALIAVGDFVSVGNAAVGDTAVNRIAQYICN